MAAAMATCSPVLLKPSLRTGAGSLRAPGCMLQLPCRSRRAGRRMQPARALMQLPERIVEQLPAQLPSSLQPSLERLMDQAASLSLTVADITNAAAADPATQAVVDAGDKATKNGGFFGPIAGLFEGILKVLDSMIAGVNIPYSYGFAIILLTILVKILTYPLTKKQVESTFAMQKIQPKVKAIQDKYKGDQTKAQTEVARLYQEAQVNPLAGCLPTLATIPVFIGLYRALSNVAEEGLLKEGFFWIPSLGGPTTLAAQKAGGGFSWLLPLTDGAPPIGWADALAYLSLPVLLVVSQFVSQKIISPPSTDPSQQSSQWILKFLPIMIGYFALNVPSGLALYWFTNNILSTSQQAWLKSSMASGGSGGGSGGGSTAEVMLPSEKAEQDRLDRVKQLTGQDTGARRSSSATQAASTPSVPAGDPRGKEKKKAQRSGEKFRALKAAEQSRKDAAATAASGNGSAPNGTNSSQEAKQEQKQD